MMLVSGVSGGRNLTRPGCHHWVDDWGLIKPQSQPSQFPIVQSKNMLHVRRSGSQTHCSDKPKPLLGNTIAAIFWSWLVIQSGHPSIAIISAPPTQLGVKTHRQCAYAWLPVWLQFRHVYNTHFVSFFPCVFSGIWPCIRVTRCAPLCKAVWRSLRSWSKSPYPRPWRLSSKSERLNCCIRIQKRGRRQFHACTF